MPCAAPRSAARRRRALTRLRLPSPRLGPSQGGPMHTFHASLRQAVAVAIEVVAGAAVASASAQAPAESQVTLPSGVTLTYVTDGDPDGEPLVLVAGTGMQLIDWPESLVRGLVERGFRVIRFDNRDVGLVDRLRGRPRPDPGGDRRGGGRGREPVPLLDAGPGRGRRRAPRRPRGS